MYIYDGIANKYVPMYFYRKRERTASIVVAAVLNGFRAIDTGTRLHTQEIHICILIAHPLKMQPVNQSTTGTHSLEYLRFRSELAHYLRALEEKI